MYFFKFHVVSMLPIMPFAYEAQARYGNTRLRNNLISSIETTLPLAGISTYYTTEASLAEQQEAHKEAKQFLKENLELIGAEVLFLQPPQQDSSESKKVCVKKDLDPFVFSYSGANVGFDIKNDGNRLSDDLVIYAVASQFNGCEAPDRYTVAPGEAVQTYQYDLTQGPQAQLSFPPEQVELINCCGNKGFNGLINVLNEDTKAAMMSGYLTPRTEKEAALVLQQLREKGHLMECPLIGNIPEKGNKKVYQFLTSAAAFGEYSLDKGSIPQEIKNEIQFLCALHSLRAQFTQAIKMATETGKPVTLKTAGMGLGVFGSNAEIFSKAYYKAAKEYEMELKATNVKVIFQVFHKGLNNPQDKAFQVTTRLGLGCSKH